MKRIVLVLLILPLGAMIGCVAARQWAVEEAQRALEAKYAELQTKMDSLTGPAPADDASMTDKIVHIVKMLEAVRREQEKPETTPAEA
jgi:outer membrane lipoprotein-sorting protein